MLLNRARQVATIWSDADRQRAIERFEREIHQVTPAYLFQDVLCVRLKCYGPNVVLLHSGVPVRLNCMPLCGLS
jgi:hypothetical protein